MEPPYQVGVLVLQVGDYELGTVHSPRQPGCIRCPRGGPQTDADELHQMLEASFSSWLHASMHHLSD